MNTPTAARKVNEYVNQFTATASSENHLQQLVRRAYITTEKAAHGILHPMLAEGYRKAAEVATGGAVTAEEIELAVRHDMGL